MQNMTDTAAYPRAGRLRSMVSGNPLLVMFLVLALVPLALAVTLTMPIGPMYWDHFLYLDGANRIFSGQVPAVDFIAPAGALGYYLFAAVISMFPNGHALLIASWCLLLVTGPLMALVVWDAQKRSPATAYALLLPFLLYSLIPFNTGDFYPYPGSDAFGIYNRQVCQLLYVLAAALVFVRGRTVLVTVTTLAMLSLLFIKVTGVVAGVVLCLMAFAAGRLTFRAAIAAGAAFFAVLALLEATTGIVSAYAEDMISLAEVNSGSFLPRLLQAASLNFGLCFAGAILCVILFYQDFDLFKERYRALSGNRNLESVRDFFDQRALWLASFICAGLLFESQNTGSQALVFLWPLALHIIIGSYRRDGATPRFAVVAVAALAISLPPAVVVVQKAARAWIGAVQNTTLAGTNLKTLTAVGAREIFWLRGRRLEKSYIQGHQTYQAVADNGELPSFLLFSDFDFQAMLLTTTDEAITALKAYEAANNVHFDTIMNIDFTNIFPWLMDRQAPKHIAIGADPFRAVPPPDDRARAALATVDIALYPTCPPATTRNALYALYEPVLSQGHRRIKLTACFDAFVRNELAPKP